MRDCIPEGWQKMNIGEACTLVNGRAFKPSDWTKTGTPIVRIQNLNDPNAEFNYCSGDVEDMVFTEMMMIALRIPLLFLKMKRVLIRKIESLS